jgi:hypothetical protein
MTHACMLSIPQNKKNKNKKKILSKKKKIRNDITIRCPIANNQVCMLPFKMLNDFHGSGFLGRKSTNIKNSLELSIF